MLSIISNYDFLFETFFYRLVQFPFYISRHSIVILTKIKLNFP